MDETIRTDLNERSPHWPAVEKHFIAANPVCLLCGKGKADGVELNAHHKYPFSYIIGLGRPDLELDFRNLRTLCVLPAHEHHCLVGHLGNYKSYNPELEKMVALCRGKDKEQIKALPEWIAAMTVRPKPFSEMTEAEKKAMRARIDAEMPLLQRLEMVMAPENLSQNSRIEQMLKQVLAGQQTIITMLGNFAAVAEMTDELKESSNTLDAALLEANRQTVFTTSIQERTTPMATGNPIIDGLITQVEASKTIEQGATVFINGEAARLQAAVQAALNGGATAAQLAPIQAEIDSFKPISDALSAALVANTPHAPPAPPAP